MRKRNIKKTFYLSDEEDKLLKEKASKIGYNESEVIRNLILGFEPREKPDERFYDSIKLLRAISNNLNQIAIRANKLNYIDKEKYFEEANNLEKIILDIKKEILLPKIVK